MKPLREYCAIAQCLKAARKITLWSDMWGPYRSRWYRWRRHAYPPMPYYMPPPFYPPYPPSPEEELRMLEEYKEELEEELKDLEEELKGVEARIEELKKMLGR